MTAAALSDENRHMLEVESGIAPDVVGARGYRTVTTKSELRGLGFSDAQARVPALLVPVHDVWGKLATYQARPLMPRIAKGKALKYETPKGSSMALDVPPAVRDRLSDPKRPLWITEGAKKADSAVSHGLDCIALLGVWNWRGTNDQGGKAILTAFDAIALNERRVYLAFDSDVIEKDAVWLALTRFGAVLDQRGADVRVIRLPGGASGAKTGLDDYFVSGGTVETLIATAQRLGDFAKTKPGDAGPYRFEDGGIWFSPNADTNTQLANFEARIVSEIRRDDGVEGRLHFDIEGKRGGTVRRFTIPAAQYAGLSWVTEHLGASAAINPGIAAKDRCRYAIQTLSGGIPQRREFAHTGWATIDGERVYLTASGGIGAAGLRADLAVCLDGPMAGYALPAPPAGDALKAAVRASLAVLEVAPLDVTMPVYGAIWRAPLGDCDYSVFVSGQTGEGKSAIAALASQHYGPELGRDGKRFAGNFEATANALEAQAFTAKDALFVADDYKPGSIGSPYERAKYERTAARLFEGSANKAGRGRMRADTSLAPAKYSRALALATGEDIPHGHSLRARLIVTELPRGAMDWDRLTACQQDADNGMYARAMAGYVHWLAAHPEQVDRLPVLRRKLRETVAGIGSHKRTPNAVADMAASSRIFLDFATACGALTEQEARQRFDGWYAALLRVARAQDEHQAGSEPSVRFRELLAASIASGRAHLADPSGGEPGNANAWGWRRDDTADGAQRWRPQGERIGWVDRDAAYLEPNASYAAAQRLAQQGGDSLGVSAIRLWKTLNERGLLLTTEQEARRSLAVRRTLEDANRRVLHVARDFFECGDSVLSKNVAKVANVREANGITSGSGDDLATFESDLSHDWLQNPGNATTETPVFTRDSGAVGYIGYKKTQEERASEENARAVALPLATFGNDVAKTATNGTENPTKVANEPAASHCQQCGKPLDEMTITARSRYCSPDCHDAARGLEVAV